MLTAAESCQSARARAGNQCLEALANQGSLFLDTSESAGLGDEIVVDVECSFHMYEYGCLSHTTQRRSGDQRLMTLNASIPLNTS